MNDKVKELMEWARLTYEESITAQQDFIKEWGRTDGQILTFPLRGELREICLLDAQIRKAYSHPDLALIDHTGKWKTFYPAIPLAQAIRERID